MSRVHISNEALEDICEILRYIAKDNLEAAIAHDARIYGQFELLARSPMLGRQADKLRKGMRCLPVGNYLIIYTPESDGIDVLRVIHGKRNIAAIFRAME